MIPWLMAVLLLDPRAAGDRNFTETSWGQFEEVDRANGLWQITLTPPGVSGWQPLPQRFPPILRAHLADEPQRSPLLLDEGRDDAAARVRIPSADRNLQERSRRLVVETIGRSGQRPDGRIVLSAADGEIAGNVTQSKDSGDMRFLLPSQPDALIRWKYQATRPGTYDVELSGAGHESESVVEFVLGSERVSRSVASAANDRQYTSSPLGRIRISGPGEYAAVLRVPPKVGRAGARVLAITLRPASEGKPIIQDDDGSIICHARDVTIHGVQVQYEPRPEKNTVGFWTNPNDRVSWVFDVARPGTFAVEILQGCGKGQGGSEVELSVGGETLRFVVEDTGHFQNFVPRVIGKVRLEQSGRNRLEVRPLRKAGVAVMDLRQVRMVPVE